MSAPEVDPPESTQSANQKKADKPGHPILKSKCALVIVAVLAALAVYAPGQFVQIVWISMIIGIILFGTRVRDSALPSPKGKLRRTIGLLIILSGVLVLLFPFVLVFIPGYLGLRDRADDSAAFTVGRSAALAEEVYFQNSGGPEKGSYTNKLNNLLDVDPNLTDMPDVKIVFGDCNQTGYTFTTWHPKAGGRTHLWMD